VLCGANTPAHIYGTIIQINAEALAGIAFSQLCRVGAPAVYGSWVATVSMKSGAPMSGTPDIDHINMMIGQMARYYKIPSRCSGGCNSSKAMDFQAGYESARNMFGAVLGGINFIFSAAGYIETAMSHSYSKFAHDIEQLEQFYAFAKGPNYDGIEAAIDAINDTRPGGHYLGHAHTLENFQTAFCLPTLMHHDSVEQWVEEGSLDANQRGLIRARQLLEEYEKPYLDPAIDEALKDFKTRRLSEIVGEVR
jgi:trimethylamine--corrinoid protein Co-methyltransferase